MLLKDMTNFTKEKQADYLMKVSSSIFSALMITLLIAPLLAIIKNNGIDNQVLLFNSFKGINGNLFIIFEVGAFMFAGYAKSKALKIYNMITPYKDGND